MEVVPLSDAAHVARVAADVIAGVVGRKPGAALGVATGGHPAPVEGPLAASCPASVLQLHPHVTVLLDPEASSSLRRLDYYREVYDAKPSWQEL